MAQPPMVPHAQAVVLMIATMRFEGEATPSETSLLAAKRRLEAWLMNDPAFKNASVLVHTTIADTVTVAPAPAPVETR